MLPKYTVSFFIALAVCSVTLAKHIPVEVRYERLEHSLSDNLAEKLQLSQEELRENELRLQKVSLLEEEPSKNYVKNLDAKVQLSPDQLTQAYKHIPIHHSIQEDDKPEYLAFMEELRNVGGLRTEGSSLKSLAEKVIEEGLENLRNSFKSNENEAAPSKELWDKLEGDARDLVQNTNLDETVRQEGGSQQNFLQVISSGFQNITNNFIQTFQRPSSDRNGTSADEGQNQGPIQGFVGFFTGGVQNIVSNIQNLGQNPQQILSNSTVLGDSTTSQPGVIGNIVSNVQQFFQGPGSTNSSDGGSNQGFFVGAISQINQAVSNIIPTTPASNAQGDEGTQQGPIQQVFQNIGNAFSQFIGQNRTQASNNKKPTTVAPTAAPTVASVTEASSSARASPEAPAPVQEPAASDAPVSPETTEATKE